MKIVTIIGARPQFIKAAAVSREIEKHENIEEILVHTGQHFDINMSDIFFEEMNIPRPDYNLSINSLSHGAMTGRMLEGIETILKKENPDWVLVYGDTNSTLAGALAATKMHIKIAHVEAGLRSFNMKMPEEINRILTDRISTVLFCPTDQAITNLMNEGYENIDCKMMKVGDVMRDAAMYYSTRSTPPNIELPEAFVLATIHRAENTDDEQKLKSIIEALNSIHQETPVVLPLHPRTKSYLKKYNIEAKFHLLDPVGYLEMVYLLDHAKLVMTDSGGLQKEAYFFKKPCVTIRNQTEWVELIDNRVNILSDASSKEDIINKYKLMKSAEFDFSKKLYGGGNASAMIIKNLTALNN